LASDIIIFNLMSANNEKRLWIVAEALQSVFQAPVYHLALEGLLLLWIIYLVFFKTSKVSFKIPLSNKEKKELLEEWNPNPLTPPLEETLKKSVTYRKVVGSPGKRINIDGFDCLNFASTNFLDLLGDERIQKKVEACIRKYGVGSCGPRGFYGTIDVHLDLEEQLAKMMQCEKAIIYSYGFATVASAIPAYAKRGDLLFVDEAVSFPIQKGIEASRSDVIYFKHNDMKDLENKLKEKEQIDKKDPKKAAVIRKFLVVEGIYANTGDLCDLPKLVELKYKYKVRLFVEESYSFGVLGKYGRGVTEHFNVPIAKIDMICATLENSLASVGGFACGSRYVISHQELSGQGYVFSASLPPLVSQASIEALNIMEDNPEIFEKLRNKAADFHQMLSSIKSIVVSGYIESPLLHIRRRNPLSDLEQEEDILRQITHQCAQQGVCLTVASRLSVELISDWQPSIKIAISVAMTTEDLKEAFNIIQTIFSDYEKP